MKSICPNCGVVERTVAQQIGGEITFGVVAATFGARATKNPLLAAICAVLGLALGHYIDQEVSKRCPQCGDLLRVTGLI
jgi:hypothetical protein